MQLVVTLLLSLYLFNRIADVPYAQVLLYGGFIFLSVFAYTTLMDRKPYAWLVEAAKSLIGMGIITLSGDWFLMADIFPAGKFVIMGYFVLSTLIVVAFVKLEIEKEDASQPSSVFSV